MALALLAPSSYNLQHWRFVAVTDRGQKQRLKEAAWGQEHVGQASAVIVVCADPRAHLQAERCWSASSPETRARLAARIRNLYDGDERLQRDEAVRSGALVSMALMLAATEAGYDSCPLIGFEPGRVAQVVEMPGDWIAVMLVALGKRTREPAPKPYQIPLEEVVKLQSFKGRGLGA